MTTWVVDTNPLIFLAKLDRLDLLTMGADMIWVPQAVAERKKAAREFTSGL